VRILSWNIASNRAGFYPSWIANTIYGHDADLCLLQEVRRDSMEAVVSTLYRRGWGSTIRRYLAPALPIGGGFGPAVIARLPLSDARAVVLPECGEARAVLRCHVGGLGVPFRAYSTHFSPRLCRVVQAHAAADWIAGDACDAAYPGFAWRQVVGFDANATWGETLEPFVRPQWHEVMGFTPTFPAADPTVKIDYLFADHRLDAVETMVPPTSSSDHRPLIADVEVA
jgi:endonuclease/exonuclease/phosphatase family metal-dependent hydrolase